MSDDQYSQNRTFDAMSTRGLAAKRELVRELEQRGDADAITQLVTCMNDESWYMRELAEEAFLRLGAAGARAIVPLLRQGLWFTRVSAARTLGRAGFGDAVPELFELTEDANTTVAAAARDALVEIGRRRGAVRIAHALHRMPPDLRRRRLDEIGQRDAALADRVDRLMRSDDLMTVSDVAALDDDSAAVRSEDTGVEWEVLTGPPPPPERSGDKGGGNG
jgi:HEAT repeat protein